MLGRWVLGCGAVWAVLWASSARGGPVLLVKDGKPAATIVLSAHSLPGERRGAEELRWHLKEMTGAALPVITDAYPLPADAILVGKDKYTDGLGVKLDPKALGDDGFVLKTVGGRLIVAGPGPRGSMYGCTALLERLGVRWFTSTVTRMPHEKTVAVPELNETEAPAFEYRDVSFTEARNKDWAARLALNGHSADLDPTTGGKIEYYPFVHSLDELVPRSLFPQHPELFPLINGRRADGYVQRCLSNPQTLKLAIAGVRRWMAEHPQAKIYSVSQNDTYNFCQCDRCTAIANRYGGQSGLYLWFVNQVARAVEKDHPDKLIDTLAYQFTEAPPKGIVPRKNVRIRLCPIGICGAHPLNECSYPPDKAFLEHLSGWGKLTDQLYIWHYATDFSHFLLPYPDFRELSGDIRLYKTSGVKGVYVEGAQAGSSDNELRSYVLAHLLWNPNRDTDAMVNEWMKGVYGKAWKPMRKWFDLLHEKAANPSYHFTCFVQPKEAHYLDGDVLQTGEKLFVEAAREARGDRVAEDSVAKARVWLEYAEYARHPSRTGLTRLADKLRRMGIRFPSEHQTLEQWEREQMGKVVD